MEIETETSMAIINNLKIIILFFCLMVGAIQLLSAGETQPGTVSLKISQIISRNCSQINSENSSQNSSKSSSENSSRNPLWMSSVELSANMLEHAREPDSIIASANVSEHAREPDSIIASDSVLVWLREGADFWDQMGKISELILFYAEKQQGIDYVEGLLDEPEEEKLVVTLEGTDCVIFVEMTLAMVMTTLNNQLYYEDFTENLGNLRYRRGKVDGYASRLHYFSDWLLTNQEKGLLHILFQDEELPEISPVAFMTENREYYRHLADDDEMLRQISQIEAALADHKLRYIPHHRIPDYESQCIDGDIIAFVSAVEGLDVAHTGLVYIDGDRTGFVHASRGKVGIPDKKTIYEYTGSRSDLKGVVIARIQMPVKE